MKKWVTRSEALDILGITVNSFKWRLKKGEIKSKDVHGQGRVNKLYLVDVEEVNVEEVNVEEVEPLEHGERDYFYNDSTDRYVFSLRSMAGKEYVLAGDVVRDMVESYSRFGHNATMIRVANAHGLHRSQAQEILKVLHKYHDSIPFTDEVIADTDEDELVADMVRLKEQKVYTKAERAIWASTVKKAEHWDRLNLQIMQPFERMLAADPKPPRQAIQPKKNQNDFSVFVMPSDLHVGKKGWALEVGKEYNIEVCEARLKSAVEDLAAKIQERGKPTKIITGTGSDFFHVDNYAGATTRGTPQDTDGSVAKIMHEGWRIWKSFIESMRQLAPVEIHNMAGNHDNVLSFALVMLCEAYWRDCPDVEVRVSPHPRSYTTAGTTLVGISHSEDTKHKDLPRLMATEARKQWGKAENSVWFTGHWHAEKTQDVGGTVVHVVPSLAGTDRWHARNGYIGSRKILPGYILDHKLGETDQLNGIPSS